MLNVRLGARLKCCHSWQISSSDSLRHLALSTTTSAKKRASTASQDPTTIRTFLHCKLASVSVTYNCNYPIHGQPGPRKLSHSSLLNLTLLLSRLIFLLPSRQYYKHSLPYHDEMSIQSSVPHRSIASLSAHPHWRHFNSCQSAGMLYDYVSAPRSNDAG